MGDAADDYFDAMDRAAANADALCDRIREHCFHWNCGPRLCRDEEGFLACKDCGESFDE